MISFFIPSIIISGHNTGEPFALFFLVFSFFLSLSVPFVFQHSVPLLVSRGVLVALTGETSRTIQRKQVTVSGVDYIVFLDMFLFVIKIWNGSTLIIW
jgi:hypothetical protein